jgi:hypothetical protein
VTTVTSHKSSVTHKLQEERGGGKEAALSIKFVKIDRKMIQVELDRQTLDYITMRSEQNVN